jgi:N-acetylmuramate 1-kinase
LASERDSEIAGFLLEAGWGGAQTEPLAGDASTRRYLRVRHNGAVAVLMDAPPKAETAPCPPDANPAERRTLGYNATARLAASRIEAFVGVASWLRSHGFAAPDIYAIDLAKGYALLEDLGDDLFARAVPAGASEPELYGAAIDVLAALHRLPAPASVNAHGAIWPVLSYDRMALMAETDLFVEWWAGRHLGANLSDAALDGWRSAWAGALDAATPANPVLTLRDYHAENVIWRPQHEGLARVGVIDFQDALAGHPAYDMVSLLEDARRDVAPELAETMIQHYLAASGADEASFRAGYAALGALRNAKIVGVFARLAIRDHKPRYIDLIPRVARHLIGDLRHETMAPVRAWLDRWLPGQLDAAAA